jgi:hypothetical protein
LLLREVSVCSLGGFGCEFEFFRGELARIEGEVNLHHTGRARTGQSRGRREHR